MGVTLRSVITGLLLTPPMCLWLALVEMVWYSGVPTTLSLHSHVVFILCLLAAANALIRRYRPAWAYSPAELLVVYIMLSISSAIAGHDFMEVLVPTLSHLHRYAAVEGRFSDILELTPQWLVVSDPTALDGAYLGGESIFAPHNFIPWLTPFAWWCAFILALCALLWGIILIFRQQWTEHEILAYPIIQAPMLIATEARALLHSRAFWAAFAIAGSINLINGLHVLFPLLPSLPVVRVVNLQDFFPERPWRDMGPAFISFYPCVIGLCFFMPLDLAFSTWFFFLFWKAQRVLAAWYGVHGMPGFPYIQEQATGGYYALACIALWLSRRRIADILRTLTGHPPPGSTPWQRREAWYAFILLTTGAATLYAFCAKAGMSPHTIILFFTLYALTSTAITRMRAELGPPSHDIFPMGPHQQTVQLLGQFEMRAHNPRDLVMFGFLNFFTRVMRTHPMPAGMEGFRIAQRLHLDQRRLLIAMAVAIIAGTCFGFWALLWAFYHYGAAARVSVLGEGLSGEAWNHVNTWLNAPTRHHPGPTFALIIGGLTALGLTTMRMNLASWPLHPVGYAISGSVTMEWMWFCFLITWVAKSLILKYGGAQAFRPASRFFTGLILGDFLIGTFWNTYGVLAETNVYHFWPY